MLLRSGRHVSTQRNTTRTSAAGTVASGDTARSTAPSRQPKATWAPDEDTGHTAAKRDRETISSSLSESQDIAESGAGESRDDDDDDDDDPSTEAMVSYFECFPSGHLIIPTPSDGLRCGQFALSISLRRQLLPRVRGVQNYQVADLNRILRRQEYLDAIEGMGLVADRLLTSDQLALILQIWGRDHGLRLRLGVVRNGYLPALLFAPAANNGDAEQPIYTVWIYNDDAEHKHGRTGHWSGLEADTKCKHESQGTTQHVDLCDADDADVTNAGPHNIPDAAHPANGPPKRRVSFDKNNGQHVAFMATPRQKRIRATGKPAGRNPPRRRHRNRRSRIRRRRGPGTPQRTAQNIARNVRNSGIFIQGNNNVVNIRTGTIQYHAR
jgi:hypothetical protein